MTDKDMIIVDMIYKALKAGYKISFESNDIGATKHGVHMHVGYVDELLDEVGDINPWDYINEKLEGKND